jgi:hypothetical protein
VVSGGLAAVLAVAGLSTAPQASAASPGAERASTASPVELPARRSGPGGYTPTTRAMFNNPLGDESAQRRIVRHLVRSIDATPRWGVIRWAVYSFADAAAADALLRAHQRGVSVRLIFAGKNVYPPMKRVQKALGSNPGARSFAIFCSSSCRGTRGEMHAKFFSFSKVGNARRVVMVGSNNLTAHNTDEQWSDLFTVADGGAYFKTLRDWFEQAKFDRPVADPYIDRTTAFARVIVSPIDLGKNDDPFMAALDRVTCLTKAGDIDPEATDPEQLISTSLLISMSAWNGVRGKRIARRVAELVRAGCTARVFYGDGVGPAVRAIVADAGGQLRWGTHKGIRTHQKTLVVNGNVAGQPKAVRVWTGSNNWSTLALRRDDIVVEIPDQAVGRQYVTAFWRTWNQA